MKGIKTNRRKQRESSKTKCLQAMRYKTYVRPRGNIKITKKEGLKWG